MPARCIRGSSQAEEVRRCWVDVSDEIEENALGMDEISFTNSGAMTHN